MSGGWWNNWRKSDRDVLETIHANQLVMLDMLSRLLNQEDTIMATLADIVAAVTAEKTVEDSVVTLLSSLSAQLKAAIASNDPVAMQAVVDSINANAATLATAVTANTA